MPNWCNNDLTVTGKKADIDKMLEAIKGTGDGSKVIPFDFEKVLPTPKELLDEPAPAEKNKAKANEIQYGAKDWYDWRVNNWGCKWGIGEDTQINIKRGTCGMGFETAWAPPTGIIKKLSEMFPNLKFKLAYVEPGMVFAGVFTAKAGEIVDDFADGSNPRAYRAIMSEYFPDTLASIEEYEEEMKGQE